MKISFRPAVRGPFNVGYTFFEDAIPSDASQTIFGEFDHIVAGSSCGPIRCANAGFKSVSVILQGIEPATSSTR